MASLAKSKQKVNELRKAHFPFGFQNNQNAKSEYKQEYLQHPIEHPPSVADKKSHFTIGSDQPSMAKNTYQSQFKQQFPGYAPQSRSTQKRTNDDNNIVLGFEPIKTNTNYRDQFAVKQGDRGKQVNQRIVSIELGDTLADFTTSYKKNFDGAQAPRTEKVDNNTGKTNLVLGYDQPAFTTTHSTSHAPKPITTSKNVQRSYGTNIVFGGDSGNFHSENKTQFAHKEASYQSVDKERVLDFRSAHFKFGFPEEQQENVSEAQARYNAKPLTKVQLQGRKPVNVQLRHDDKNYFQSSYGDHFQKKQPSKAQILNKNGRNTNVIIGLGKETYNSQAKDQFVAKNVERVKGKGAQGSIQLGDGSRDFTTQYKQTFVDKKTDVQRNKVSKEDINKMRAQSYVVGFTGPDYQLHSMSYGQAPGETNKLSRQTIDKMRGTNIVYGNNEFQGKTIHSSSYGWKKNDDF